MRRNVAMGRYPMLVLVVALSGARAHAQNAPNVVSAAAELGVAPESMVLAGFQPDHAAVVLTRVQQAGELCHAIEMGHLEADAAAEQVTELAETLLDEPANDQAAAQYQQALAQLATHHQQIGQLCTQLVGLATDGAPADQLQRLIIWRSGALYDVPREFRVRERTVHDWRAIVRALRAEARAARLEEDLDQVHAALLAEVRSDPRVVQAALDLESNLAAMAAVFEAFGN